MDGQMTIFDCFPSLAEVDIENMTEEYLVNRISEATWLKFERVNATWLEHDYFRAKWKNARFDICLDNYEGVENGKRFIGCDYECGTSGSSSPCDSLGEAIRFIKKRMSEHEKG